MMSIIEDLLTTIILRGRKLTTLSLKKISPRYDLKSQKLSLIHHPSTWRALGKFYPLPKYKFDIVVK